MAGRRAEVPHDRLVALGEQAEAVELVLRPRADVRGRDVADVRHVEAQQRAQLRLGQQRRDPRQPLLAQPVEAHALLPVDRHRPVGMECHVCSRSQLALQTFAMNLGVPAARRLDSAARQPVQTFAAMRGRGRRRARRRLGWVGTGRMGYALATRLLEAGCDVARLQPHALEGRAARRARARPSSTRPAELADRDIVFTMVAGPADFKEVVLGEHGLLSSPDAAPARDRRLDHDLARRVGRGARPRPTRAASRCSPRRSAATRRSSTPGCSRSSCPGPQDACGGARRYLELLRRRRHLRGRGRRARLVKICHNLMLGVVAQSLAEIMVLAEKGGVSRAAFMEFLNDSVMGSMFTRYKTPAYVNLDFKPTFTPELLLQGLPPRLRGGARARRADAGRRGRPAGGAGADGQRLRRRGLRGAARAGGARARRWSSSPRTSRSATAYRTPSRVEVAP